MNDALTHGRKDGFDMSSTDGMPTYLDHPYAYIRLRSFTITHRTEEVPAKNAAEAMKLERKREYVALLPEVTATVHGHHWLADDRVHVTYQGKRYTFVLTTRHYAAGVASEGPPTQWQDLVCIGVEDVLVPPPLQVPCEGSNWPVHVPSMNGGTCKMCGVLVTCDDDRLAYPHERRHEDPMRGSTRGLGWKPARMPPGGWDA